MIFDERKRGKMKKNPQKTVKLTEDWNNKRMDQISFSSEVIRKVDPKLDFLLQGSYHEDVICLMLEIRRVGRQIGLYEMQDCLDPHILRGLAISLPDLLSIPRDDLGTAIATTVAAVLSEKAELEIEVNDGTVTFGITVAALDGQYSSSVTVEYSQLSEYIKLVTPPEPAPDLERQE